MEIEKVNLESELSNRLKDLDFRNNKLNSLEDEIKLINNELDQKQNLILNLQIN